MKTKLKFFLVFLALMVGGVNGAWANEEYKFAEWGGKSGATLNMTGSAGDYSAIYQGQYAYSISTSSDGTFTLNSRFAFRKYIQNVSNGHGWQLTSKGLHLYTEGRTPELAICNLWNGDRIIVTFDGSLQFVNAYSAKVGGSFVTEDQQLTSNVEFSAVADGDIIIKATNGNTYISKIEIIPQSGGRAISFSEHSFAKQRVGGSFTEPTLSTLSPTTATPYYSSSNTSVATVNERTGDVTFVGAGMVNITATLTVGGISVSDSYSLNVGSATSGSNTYSFLGNTEDNANISSVNTEMGCENDWDSFTFDGITGCYLLKFRNVTIGNGLFTHNDNRFVVHEEGWQLDQYGLRNNNTGTFDLYILKLQNGERVTVNLKDNATATITSGNTKTYELDGSEWKLKSPTNNVLNSGQEYIMQGDGTLKLKIPSGVHIESVIIEHENASPSLSFSKETDTYDLVTLNYTEPTVTVVPAGAKVEFSSSNPKVAKIGSADGDLMIINTGIVTITGKLIINGSEVASDSYTLTIKAEEAAWDIQNGNELYFPTQNTNPDAIANNRYNDNTGKLLNRRVTSVPHIVMEFGNADNTNLTMVNFHHDTRSANLIDENGWQHVWLQNQGDFTMKPYQGTFYTFKPSISGKLTIKGVRSHNGSGANTVVLVDANKTGAVDWDDDVDVTSGQTKRRTRSTQNGKKYYSYYIEKYLSFANDVTYSVTEEQIDLVGGHTYYLYANTPNTNNDVGASGDWQNFYLSGFKYETAFHFANQNVVIDDPALNLGEGTYEPKKASGYNHDVLTVGDDGKLEYQQTISGTGITYDFVPKGDITAEMPDKSNGKLTNISGHGAIVVTATLTEGSATSTTSYVLTVPYTNCTEITGGGKKSWVFNWENYKYNSGKPTGTNKMEQVEILRKNAPYDWTIEYKVRRYADDGTKALNYINVPVLANALDVKGDNARYIGSTNGLLFNADIKTFGTTTSIKNDQFIMEDLGGSVKKVKAYTKYELVDGKKIPLLSREEEEEKDYYGPEWLELTDAADIDEALKTLLNYDAEDARDPCNYLTMENGTSMTIPNLKKGQYVRIKWSRYSPNHGDIMTVSNLNDLAGVEVEKPITIGAGGNVDRNGGTGYHEFIVKADGDVTFTLSQDGWANIYEVDVSNNFIATDLQLEQGKALMRKASSSTTFTNAYTINWGDVLCQSNTLVQYAIKSGTATGTLDGKLSVVNNPDDENTTNNPQRPRVLNVGAGGHGRFVLHQQGYVKSTDKSASYLLDQNEHLIKVYEYDYPALSYPRTWNAENMSTATGTALSGDLGGPLPCWQNSESDKYKLTLEPENLIAWQYKDGTAISELNGLGIRPADISKTNSIVLGANNTGIELSTTDTEILTVPNVAVGSTAYIRVLKGATDATDKVTAMNADGTDVTLTQVYSSGSYSVYSVPGSGKDIDFYLKDVTVLQTAVSTDTKTVTAAGYATEARNYPVDYTMANTFLGRPQRAYKITGVEGNKAIAESVDFVPQMPEGYYSSALGYGVMVSGTVGTQSEWPLFTWDVNRTASNMTGNLLIGVTDNSSLTGENSLSMMSGSKYNYYLASQGYIFDYASPDDYDKPDVTGRQIGTASGLGFYLVTKKGTNVNGSTYAGSTPKNNSAYLQLDSRYVVHTGLNTSGGSGVRQFFAIDFDDETTDIKVVESVSSAHDSIHDDAFYSLQGVRVKNPGKGVYVRNGKMIFVK